jgi:type II secretory pathway pseudopilin PulG
MTLLEVILAIAVAGFVLASAVSFLVSISTIWSERQARNFFEDHVDGVTEFLNASFASAGVEIALGTEETNTNINGNPNETEQNQVPKISVNIENNAGSINTETNNTDSTNTSGGLVRSVEEPIAWASPPGFADYKDPLLNFKLTTAPAVLVGIENAPLIGINLFIYFEPDEGLSLLWYSTLQEESEDINDLRRTSVSPFVTAIRYIYWDERFEKWEEEEEPKEGEGQNQYILPRFIKLIFEYKGETRERTITIPVPSKSVVLF